MPLLNKKVLAEFLGTTVFLASIVGSSASANPFAQASLAITLGLMILLFGQISGGHFNPVVSVYFFATKKLSLSELLTYVVAQLFGGFVGAFVGISIWGGTISYGGQSVANLAPHLGGEVLATAGLVALIGYLANTGRENMIWAAVALWVFAAGIFTQTGAQANPAVSLALVFAGHAFNDQALIVIAEFVGLLLAVMLLIFIVKPDQVTKRSKKK
ncbi:MAG: hypothetical protein RL670_1133 [Actinomycetota bacterium]|jgi:arsenate reductase